MGMLVRGKYVITDPQMGEKGILSDGAIYVSGGKVAEVGSYESLRATHAGAEVRGNGRQLLMPGLIDGHCHGWGLSAIQRGILYDYLENALLDWSFMRDLDPELNAMMCAVRHLRNGCTTMHHNNWGEAASRAELADKSINAYRKVGIRLAFSPGIRDESILALDDVAFFETLPPDLQEFARPMVFYDKGALVDEYLSLFDDLHQRYYGDDVRIIFGPSWAHGATDDFLQRVKAKADSLGKLPIHIHTLQTPAQKAYGLKKFGKSVLAHFDDLGLVDENLVLGHAVFVTEADIELLAARRASTTHHASCNLAMRNGIAPVYYMLRAGVNVALGIDDKAINDDEDPLMELRLIHRLHRVPGFDLGHTPALNAFDVLAVGTTNAARVCGFAGEIGALTPGMRADAILIDLEEILEDPWASPELNVAEMLIHRGRGSQVNTVIVGGKVVMDERRFLTIDVHQLYEEVRRQAARGIDPEQRQFAEQLNRLRPWYHRYYRDWAEMDFSPFYVMNSRI